MAVFIIQSPASASLSQSPVVYNVSSSTDVGQPQFQYKLDLYYWTGSISNSGSTPSYTLSKYPNQALVGIFDVSRIVNSTLTSTAFENPSNTTWIKGDAYYKYFITASSTYVTSSHLQSKPTIALDGYALSPSLIDFNLLPVETYFPFLTSGPSSQSVYLESPGELGVYKGNIAQTNIVTSVVYSGSNGSNGVYNLVTSTNTTSTQIERVPFSPGQTGFPLTTLTTGHTYSIQAYSGSVSLSPKINYSIDCRKIYPNVRVMWKNKYGQFDYYNFNGVNRETFNTKTQTYQPTVGTWNSRTLSVGANESSILNYITDTSQTIQVNTDWLDEEYNDVFKQLLVSDEIYWLYNEKTSGTDVKPLTIKTNALQFKTYVNDKQIQYTIEFELGQSYKFII
jgi:hypothetical protein